MPYEKKRTIKIPTMNHFSIRKIRNIVLIIVCIITIQNIMAQGSLLYEDLQREGASKIFKKGQEYNTIILRNNHQISVGDTLLIGEPTPGATNSLVPATNNTISSVNKIAGISDIRTKTYMTIVKGELKVGSIVPPVLSFLNDGNKGNKIVIDRIYIYYSSKYGVYPYLKTHLVENDGKLFTILDINQAISNGEVVNPNAPLNRDEAINKLKQAKDLLDLEMITKEEYNELKQELTPIIMGK